MRYYNISLTPILTSSTAPLAPKLWSSFPNGIYDPGALNVQFDLYVTVGSKPVGNSQLSIEGVALSELINAPNYGLAPASQGGAPTYSIVILGGFKSPPGNTLPGWPQPPSGTLAIGAIGQCYGNWVGTQISLDFTLFGGQGAPAAATTLANPINLVFNWQPTLTLQVALQNALSTAYPGTPINGLDTLSNYTPPNAAPQLHWAATFTDFCRKIKSMTMAQSPGKTGVDITMQGGAIYVTDYPVIGSTTGSVPNFPIIGSTIGVSGPIQLNYTDFIGQPTWIDQNKITFTTVMRGDIKVNSAVLFPAALQNLPGFTTQTAAAAPSNLRQVINWANQPFYIQAVRHVGNFRDTSPDAWVSVFQAYPNTVPATQTDMPLGIGN